MDELNSLQNALPGSPVLNVYGLIGATTVFFYKISDDPQWVMVDDVPINDLNMDRLFEFVRDALQEPLATSATFMYNMHYLVPAIPLETDDDLENCFSQPDPIIIHVEFHYDHQ